ncbi:MULTISPECIES: hypothetical protein [unclassified Nocardioides]|uniref:hypothetical protein n=1 Tax=unclassified Nocardioides TaxID=2615069 RepID=UPI0006F75DB7|nr:MULTISPECIES: hypothetical protein [unclassified Nocardioides]KRA37962.1 hypothetical protein ASD81_04565 [Nocardioides sp. Root614]KRA91922.1 hypothetical protein ASD84_04830 [Nocardioides sp. Root682]
MYRLETDNAAAQPDPTVDTIADAVDRIKAFAIFYFILIDGDDEDRFFQTSLPEDPDDVWTLEHRNEGGQFTCDVPADQVVTIAAQWVGLLPGFDPGPPWRLLTDDELAGGSDDGDYDDLEDKDPKDKDPKDKDPKDKDPKDLPVLTWLPGTDPSQFLVDDLFVYADENGPLILDQDAVADLDVYGTVGWGTARGQDGNEYTVKQVLNRADRDLMESLFADPQFTGRIDDTFFDEHQIQERSTNQWERIQFRIILGKLWRRRVVDRLQPIAVPLAEQIVSLPEFSPRNETLIRSQVAALVATIPDASPHLGRYVREAVRDLDHAQNLTEKADKAARKAAKGYLAGLSAAELDRFAFLNSEERAAVVAVSHPHLSAEQLEEFSYDFLKPLAKKWPERELYYSTVARALIGTGRTRKDVAALLGIKQARMSARMAKAPEDVTLPVNHHLRSLVAGIVELNDTMPTVGDVFNARKSVWRVENAEWEQERAQQAALGDEVDAWTQQVLAALDAAGKDQFALQTGAEREAWCKELLPDLPKVAYNAIARKVVHELWQIDPIARLFRYGQAVVALKERGSTRAGAARYLNISASYATDAEWNALKKPKARLDDDDYLVELVEAWTK